MVAVSLLKDVIVYESEELSGGAVAGIVIASLLFAVLIYVLTSWLLYRIGKRLGYEHSWYAWVPILNYWMITELGGKDLTWFIIMIVFSFCCGLVTMVMMIMLFMEIAERCGEERWYGILMIIPIVNWIIMYKLGSGPAVPPRPPASGSPGQYGAPPLAPPPTYTQPPQQPPTYTPPPPPPPPPPQQ